MLANTSSPLSSSHDEARVKRLHRYLPLLLLGWALGQGDAAERTAGDDRHEQGRAIYNYRCYFCHGYSGDAKTLSSTYLDPAPLDFSRTDPDSLERDNMIASVTSGKTGTAMQGFSRVLSAAEIESVVDFVRSEFMHGRRANSRYHTAANGWPDHDRYRHAYPFATGAIPLDTPWQKLSGLEARGKRLFLNSCISCHDRAVVRNPGGIWRKQSVSYPRNHYSHRGTDAVSAASVYAGHDVAPRVERLSMAAVRGKKLWQQNCAFCHAADGSGENWIGSFLVPAPRDLTATGFMRSMNRSQLRQRILDGLPNTSMPAWRSVLNEAQIEQIISYIDEAFHPLPPE